MADPSFMGPGAQINLGVSFLKNGYKNLIYKFYINTRLVNTLLSPLQGFWKGLIALTLSALKH